MSLRSAADHRAQTARPSGPGQQQAITRDLAGRERPGPFPVFIGAKLEIIAVNGDVLAVLGLDFYLSDDIMSAQVLADYFLDGGGVNVERDIENHVFILAAGRTDGFFGSRQEQPRQEEQCANTDNGPSSHPKDPPLPIIPFA